MESHLLNGVAAEHKVDWIAVRGFRLGHRRQVGCPPAPGGGQRDGVRPARDRIGPAEPRHRHRMTASTEHRPGPVGPEGLERATGIEPARSVWKTEALPLSYARVRPHTPGRAHTLPAPPTPRASAFPPARTPSFLPSFPGDQEVCVTYGDQLDANFLITRAGWPPRRGGRRGGVAGGGWPGGWGRPGILEGRDGIHFSSPRGVAQLGSALALGARGRGFKSRHPDCRPRPGRPGRRRAARAQPDVAGSPTLDAAESRARPQTTRSVKEYACEEHRRDSEPDPGAARHRGAVRRARAEPQEGVPGDRRAGRRSPASARARCRPR